MRHELPYLTTEQMMEVDRAMVQDFHVELLQMMENAGRSLAHLARVRFLEGSPAGKRVAVLAGPGGNGNVDLGAAQARVSGAGGSPLHRRALRGRHRRTAKLVFKGAVIAFPKPYLCRRRHPSPALTRCMNPPFTEFIFIWNADGGWVNAVKDSLRKLTRSKRACTLCTITHNLVGEKKTWRRVCRSFGLSVRHYHRDELPDEISSFLQRRQVQLPAVLGRQAQGYALLINSTQIEACQGSPSCLESLLKGAL